MPASEVLKSRNLTVESLDVGAMHVALERPVVSRRASASLEILRDHATVVPLGRRLRRSRGMVGVEPGHPTAVVENSLADEREKRALVDLRSITSVARAEADVNVLFVIAHACKWRARILSPSCSHSDDEQCSATDLPCCCLDPP